MKTKTSGKKINDFEIFKSKGIEIMRFLIDLYAEQEGITFTYTLLERGESNEKNIEIKAKAGC